MAFDFSLPTGEIAARELDLREQTGWSNIAMQAAQVRRYDMDTQKMQAELLAQQAVSAALAKRRLARGAVEEADSQVVEKPSAPYWETANLMLEAGALEQSQKAASTASLIDSREARAQNSEAQTRINDLKRRASQVEIFQGFVRNAKDPISYAQANAAYERIYREPSPLRGLPYSPELVQRLGDIALSQKESLDIDIRRQDLDSKLADRESAQQYRKDNTAYHKRMAATAELRAERTGKIAGEKTIPAASEADVTTASQMLISDMFPDKALKQLSAENRNAVLSASRDMADEAERRLRLNKGLTRSEALAQIYAEKKASGELEFIKKGMFDWGKSEVRYKGLGKGMASPAPWPATAAAAKEGQYYLAPNGQVVQALGNGRFKQMSQPTAPAPGGSGEATEDEEDE